jgi:pimeloyl-ACP methyl ester carboxylesterase/DNA-binding CsgD family transcriptional regulator
VSLKQKVRFCTARDGVRIAYAVSGEGPVLVRAPHWLTHLEYDWNFPVRRQWIEELSKTYTFVRFDPRGCGLSERKLLNASLDEWVCDLEAVVDAAGLQRFALLGPSQGGAVAIRYAARHAQRVSHLVLFGAFGRGKLMRGNAAETEDALAQLKLVELGWGSDDPAYRQVFASQMMPGASPQEMASLTEMMRVSASAEHALRLIRMFYSIDVMDTAASLRCATLAVHSRGDRRVPHDEGRLLAAQIPGAQFVTLESINHMLPRGDPAWEPFLAELQAFYPPGAGGLQVFTARELEVLTHLAQGLDNARIAAKIGLSEKTVRNHMTRVFEKLNVQHRGEAIVRARKAGLG